MKKAMWSTAIVIVLGVWSSQDLAAASQAASPVSAPPAASAAAPHWHTVQGDWVDAFHHPFDGLEMGLDLRLRNEYSHNTTSVDDQFGDPSSKTDTATLRAKGIKPGNWNEGNAQRYRMRWSTIWTLAPDVTFNTRLVWEFWTFQSPIHTYNTESGSGADTDFRELIFDRLNIQWKNAFDAPMTLTIGRQDITLGTGWLVNEGTPNDGSRTMYFDAARMTIDLSDKTQLDLIGITQYDDEETWLTPFNHRDFLHVTQKTDENGFIAYLTDKSIENTQLEAYYIYKKDEPSNWTQFWQNRSKNWSTTPGLNAEIHTIGGRIAQNLDENWSYSVEAAKQFGTRDDESMKGLGSNDKLAYAFNDEWKNELRTTFEYLSGDKPGTAGNERFDLLWGKWAQPQRGGELINTTYTFETATYDITNLYRWGFGHTFKPVKDWTFSTDYNLLWADQNTKGDSSSPSGTYGSPQYSSSGNFRGQLFSWLATYSCCKNFKTYFMLDYFIPGSYYDESTRDHAVFARVNVEWTF